MRCQETVILEMTMYAKAFAPETGGSSSPATDVGTELIALRADVSGLANSVGRLVRDAPELARQSFKIADPPQPPAGDIYRCRSRVRAVAHYCSIIGSFFEPGCGGIGLELDDAGPLLLVQRALAAPYGSTALPPRSQHAYFNSENLVLVPARGALYSHA